MPIPPEIDDQVLPGTGVLYELNVGSIRVEQFQYQYQCQCASDDCTVFSALCEVILHTVFVLNKGTGTSTTTGPMHVGCHP